MYKRQLILLEIAFHIRQSRIHSAICLDHHIGGHLLLSLIHISLVLLSIILTGFNVYDNIAKHAGAGTLVPITGFANAVASPAIEFKSEGLVTGLGAKMFIIACLLYTSRCV